MPRGGLDTPQQRRSVGDQFSYVAGQRIKGWRCHSQARAPNGTLSSLISRKSGIRGLTMTSTRRPLCVPHGVATELGMQRVGMRSIEDQQASEMTGSQLGASVIQEPDETDQ